VRQYGCRMSSQAGGSREVWVRARRMLEEDAMECVKEEEVIRDLRRQNSGSRREGVISKERGDEGN